MVMSGSASRSTSVRPWFHTTLDLAPCGIQVNLSTDWLRMLPHDLDLLEPLPVGCLGVTPPLERVPLLDRHFSGKVPRRQPPTIFRHFGHKGRAIMVLEALAKTRCTLIRR